MLECNYSIMIKVIESVLEPQIGLMPILFFVKIKHTSYSFLCDVLQEGAVKK